MYNYGYYNYYHRQEMPECPFGEIYTVEVGDSIRGIAEKFDKYFVTMDAILEANPDLPGDLYVGKKICIPYPCPIKLGEIITVQPGDTIEGIAKRYGFSVYGLLNGNPWIDPDNLYVGQKICLSHPGIYCQIYVIKPGDTIYSIARRYDLSVDLILAVNPRLDPDQLSAGYTICFPRGPIFDECPGQLYTIKAGDTINRIAQRYGFSLEEIYYVNPELDVELLAIGQEICLPRKVFEECPGQLYTIKAGDSFYKLAQKFGVSVDSIIAVNPGVDPNTLQIGQTICLPEKVIEECPGQLYTIKAGDSFYKLAQKFGVSVDSIIAVNPGVNPNNLQIGQTICLPEKVIEECPGQLYTIKAGDSFYKLAQKFGVSVEAIIAANPGINPNNLQIGQEICLPS